MARNAQIDNARLARVSGRVAATPIPGMALDAASAEPLHRQLYAALRDAILTARLRPGARLPSTRLLAESLELSRTTVALAYDQLRAEGYVRGRERSGTFVTSLLPEEALAAPPPSVVPAVPSSALAVSRPSAVGRGVARPSAAGGVPGAWTGGASSTGAPSGGAPSARGRLIDSLLVSSTSTPGGSPPIAFRLGTPALDRFPFTLWGALLSRRWRALTASQLSYGDPAGYAPLREAIATYARQARGAACEASQVIVVSGAQQAFDLVARVLLDPGDTVAVEDPGYRGARAAFVAAGATLAPVPVDREGMDVARLRAVAPRARLACVTPSHQFPLGVTMSARRRLALLEWARAAGAWIVEDDFDSEYRFRGRPLPSLHGMDAAGCVLYVGTFSKTLFPALRLGYLIVPSPLVDVFARARATVDRHPSALEQAVLAEFIAEGHFARHVRRMRALYAERQEVLLSLLGSELGALLEGERMEAGMHLVAWLRDDGDDDGGERGNVDRDRRLAAAALDAGVAAVALGSLATHTPARGALLLGFAAFDDEAMRRGVGRLRQAAGELSSRPAASR